MIISNRATEDRMEYAAGAMTQIAAGGTRITGLIVLLIVMPSCSGCRHQGQGIDGSADDRSVDTVTDHVGEGDSPDSDDAGPAAEMVASDPDGPSGLALDAEFVYWANDVTGKVSRVRKSGGVPELLCTVGRIGIIDLAVDDAFVYLTAPPDGSAASYGVLRVPKTGGAVEVLSSQESNPHGLLVDAGELFWMTGTTAATGGPRKMDLATRQKMALADGFIATGHLTVDAGSVYFTVGRPKGQGKIVRVPRSGGQSTELASAEQGPWGIWNDNQFVYWTDGFYDDSDSRGIKRLGKTASPSTTPEVLRVVPDPPAQLLGDGTNLYWNDYPGDQIWELAKAPAAAPRRLALGFNVADMASDADFVYWVNLSPPRGGVYRIAK